MSSETHTAPTAGLHDALAGLLARLRPTRITPQPRTRPPRRRMRIGDAPFVPPVVWSIDREDLRAALEEQRFRSR
jgi:hypothetical protein